MRYMRVRKISLQVTGCYYPFLKHSHSALPHHTTRYSKWMMFGVNVHYYKHPSLLLKQSCDAATASRNPHRPRHAPLPLISWPVVGSRCHWQRERTSLHTLISLVNVLTRETYAIFSNFLTCFKFPYAKCAPRGAVLLAANVTILSHFTETLAYE